MRVWPSRKSAVAEKSSHDIYTVKCECGQIVTGDREPSAQEVPCPACQSLLYILPIDVYPRPRIVSPRKPTAEEAGAVRITFAEAREEAEPQASRDDERLARPVDDTPERIWIERGQGGAIRKRILQLAALAGLIALAAAWGISYRNHLREAEELYREHREAAWLAVDEQNWNEAIAAATVARNAADDLGWDDAAAREIVCLEEELKIVERLSGLSLVEIVLEKEQGDYSNEDWQKRFQIHHAGSWLLLQGEILRKQGKEDVEYSFAFPASLPGQEVTLRWSGAPAWIDEMTFEQDRADAFVAMRMTGAHFKGDATDWEITIAGSEARLWTQEKILEGVFHLDWTTDEQLAMREVIRGQRKRLGLGETE